MKRKRGNSRIAGIAFLLTAAAAMLGQSESEPYFALASYRTFASNGKPVISLSSFHLDSLEFRVYRINDPMKFFKQLDDPHQFGGTVPRPPRDRTLLEVIHDWKRGLRAEIRRSLRGQFTEPPSVRLQSLLPARQSPSARNPPITGTQATSYAEAPLLNPQQLVLSFVRNIPAKSAWDREDLEVPVKDKGVYLVEAVRKGLRAYTLVMVSDLAMITKTGSGKVVNIVLDRASGQPLQDVTVTAFTKQGEISHGVTSADGIAELHAAPPRDGDLMILARKGPDVAVNEVRGGNFGPNAEQWAGYIYTDRPVYRPGHAVHFKGIFRLRTANGFDVPSGRKLSVEIDDPDRKAVYQKTLTASANGTIHDDLMLAPGASLGSYDIQVKSDDAFINGDFEVQDYKKPEYEVRVVPSKARVIQGETVSAVVDARYFFGEPVSGAKVKYSVYREPYWFPLWYDPDEDVPQQEPDADDSGDQLSDQQAQLDADGKLTIKVPTSLSDHKGDYMYRVEVGVTDAANREISGTGWIVATYGSFALNIAPEQYVFSPGSQGAFTIEARDYDNNPIRTRAHVELLKWTFRGGPGAGLSATDADLAAGSAKVTLGIPQQGGSYMVRATARTPEGRDVQAFTYVWVSGGSWGQDANRDQSVQMITDKKSYHAGDTARILIVAGQAGTPVFVTVEGRDVRQQKLIRSQNATVAFELPVTAKDEPGISVNASFVRNGMTYVGSKYVRVPPAEHELNVRVTTDKPQYQPGQAANYNIEVADMDGKPVPQAEFSLGIVDEAIYGVRKDTTQNILSVFFSHDYNQVPTENSLEYYFNGEAGRRRMQLAALRPRSRLAQLKPERMIQPKVRKAFPDTTFWAADLVTDNAGRAHAKVEFPDSLTTWRATARGITRDTKVGNTTLKTIVRKNLILRLAAPRFFVQGDEMVISVLVHNYLQDVKTARVSLDVKGLDVLEGATKEVQIPSRGEARVDWKVRAQKVRSVTLTGKALTNEESDALEMELPVDIPGVKLSQSKGGSMAAGGSAAFDVAFPEKVEPGSRSLSIGLSPSIAGSLFGALDFLTSYPYGCVEQTMSSFLPNIVVKDAVRTLNLKVDLDDAGLQQKIRDGLDRLYSFQHPDGGWGWWATDDSHPFMTAYVVAGLLQARAARVRVQQDTIDKGVAWLKVQVKADAKQTSDLRAYLAYALGLAGQPDSGVIADLFNRRLTLSPYGLAILGLAMESAQDGRAGQIAAELEKSAEQDQEQAWWTATRDPMLDFAADVTPEATAYVAKLLSHERKDSPVLPKAALWLMNHRDEGYWWSSTKQTAMVIYGLTDYLKTTKELMPNLTATVFVNDKAVLTRKIDQATALNPPDLVLDESQLQPGVDHIRVTTTGEGRLYYSTRGEYYSRDTGLQKTAKVSLNLLRDYFRLAPAKIGDRIVYDTVPLDGPVSVGDVIAVRLTVTGSEWKYLMVEDPIPAGAEFIERDNLYELRNKPSWWRYFFTRRELHDDRMAIFQTYFPQGQQQYFYLLKVVNPGAFEISPARVEPMYQPGVMATTESRRLEVR